MAPEKWSEVHQGRACDRVDERRSVRCFDADRQGIGKQPGGRGSTGSGSVLRQALARNPAAGREVLDLVVLTGEPCHLGRFEDGVEQHQPRHDGGRRNRPTEPALRLADGSVQRSVMNVVDERPIVKARADRREPAAHQALEEPVDPVPVGDVGERRVLPRQADAGVGHHGHQEARLAFGETQSCDGVDAFLGGHDSTSSARPGHFRRVLRGCRRHRARRRPTEPAWYRRTPSAQRRPRGRLDSAPW